MLLKLFWRQFPDFPPGLTIVVTIAIVAAANLRCEPWRS